MSLEVTLVGVDFLKCRAEILLVGLRYARGHATFEERYAALERVQDRREVLSRDGEAGLLGACSRSAPRRTFGSSISRMSKS